jgi:hypothetical protein
VVADPVVIAVAVVDSENQAVVDTEIEDGIDKTSLSIMSKYSYLFLLFIIAIQNSLSQVTSPPSEKQRETFERVEIAPSFPGGIAMWRKFLEQNLDAGVATNNGAPIGMYTVMVRFVVDKEGAVSDIKPLTKLGYGMEQEVVRVIKKSPVWNPGIQNGRAVNSYHTQPVSFSVSDEALDITSKVKYVLFTNQDNSIAIEPGKVNLKDLDASITNGKIISLNDGIAIVRVTDTTKRAVITVYNKKKNKEIGSVSFEVRSGNQDLDAKKD